LGALAVLDWVGLGGGGVYQEWGRGLALEIAVVLDA